MSFFDTLLPVLRLLPPETAHTLALFGLRHGPSIPAPARFSPALRQHLWGLDFPHPLGMAAGFDKNAEVVRPLLRQGFSFVEAGTLTPQPQPGNPRPRLFRLKEDRAVINRMGFNGKGGAYAYGRLREARARPLPGVVAVNIGKNKDTLAAEEDYLALLAQFYTLADFFVINLSSPNTPGLRDLQRHEALSALLEKLVRERQTQAASTGRQVPLLLKVAPDITEEEAGDIAGLARAYFLDGLVIGNTTVARPESLRSMHRAEGGGLSGAPLMEPSTRLLGLFYRLTQGKIPLIGVGGILSGDDAWRKIRAGASLLELYTGLVYHGFGLLREILDTLETRLREEGFSSVREATGADHRETPSGSAP